MCWEIQLRNTKTNVFSGEVCVETTAVGSNTMSKTNVDGETHSYCENHKTVIYERQIRFLVPLHYF